MKKLLFSNKAKILLGSIAIIIVLIFAKSSIRKNADELNHELDAKLIDIALTNKIFAEEIDSLKNENFLQHTEILRIQADIAVNMDWSEKNHAMTKIGEEIQYLLSSDYAEAFGENTSIGDYLSFYVEDYPLQNSLLRRIVYTLSYRQDGIDQTDTRSFLQYVGEKTVFSNIEYIYNFEQDNKLQVFENKDGIFAFLLFEGYEQTVFSTNENFKIPTATVYVIENESFRIENNISVPIKVAQGLNFQLVQQGGAIKGIVSDYQYSAECTFNTSKLIFESPETNLKSDSVNYTIPNLLLGLSDSNGNLRTLFIRMEEDKIRATEYFEQIIFSQNNTLHSVKHYTQYEESYESYLGDESFYPTGHTDIKKLLCGSLGDDLTEEFNQIFSKRNANWGFYELTDIPLYIGEDYICYIQKDYESGGGSFRASTSDVRFDKLDNLTDFKMDGWLQPNFKQEYVADLAYGTKAQALYKENIYTYGGNLSPSVDFKQLAVKRNLGKWSFMLPITEEYFHPGNGSYFENITSFAAYDNDVSSIVHTNHEYVSLGSWRNWEAKDIFNFPQTDIELTQYDYFLGIGKNDAGYGDFDLSIPVNLDEYIVSISLINDDERVVLNQYEEISQIKSLGHNISLYAQIHEELSGFSFNIQGEKDDSLYSAKKLSIYYEYELLQEFEFEYNEFIGAYPQSYSENFGFVIEDMNFDGYKDIRLIYYVPAAPNISYLYWVWDVEAGMFIKDSDLGGVLSPSFDHENELVLSYKRGSAVSHYVETYRYIDGKLTLIKREESGLVNDKDRENSYIMEYELIDGEWQITKEERIEMK